MNTINIAEFILSWTIAGLIVHFIQLKLAGTPLGNAMAFIYG